MSTLSFSGSGNRKKQSPLARPASEEINAERRLKTMANLCRTKVVKNTSVRYWSPFEHTWPPCNVGPMHVQQHVSFLRILRSHSRHLKVSRGLIPSLDTMYFNDESMIQLIFNHQPSTQFPPFPRWKRPFFFSAWQRRSNSRMSRSKSKASDSPRRKQANEGWSTHTKLSTNHWLKYAKMMFWVFMYTV